MDHSVPSLPPGHGLLQLSISDETKGKMMNLCGESMSVFSNFKTTREMLQLQHPNYVMIF